MTKTKASAPRVHSGLEPAWPSSPVRPPNYVISARNIENGHLFTIGTVGRYAAKKILDAFMETVTEYERLDERQLRVGPVRINTMDLPAIMGHEYSELERQWMLPDEVVRHVNRLVLGSAKRPDPALAVLMPGPAPEKPKEPPRAKSTAGDEVAEKLASVGVGIALKELAQLNGVWKDEYELLDNGRRRMAVGNRLRGMQRRGENVRWA